MAGYHDQVLKLDIPGDLPISLKAHYDLEIYGDKRSWDMSYKIELVCFEWSLAGHEMSDIEGGEIPPMMRNKILAAITISDEEMCDALNDEADEEEFRRSHAAGRV